MTMQAVDLYDEKREVFPEGFPPPTSENLVYDEDEANLVHSFIESTEGQRALRSITDFMLGEFKQSWDKSEPWRKRFADDLKLLMGELPPKEGAMKNCANANIPTSLENISRLALRMEDEVFGDWQNVCTYQKIDPKAQTDAEIQSVHTNWQLRTQIRDFKRQMARAILMFLYGGDVTCHSYFDRFRNSNRHEIMTPDTFCVPWSHTSTMPDYSDSPWYAKVYSLYSHELAEFAEDDRGEPLWWGVDKVLAMYQGSHEDEPEQPVAAGVAREQGKEPEDSTKVAPHKMIWWEGWLTMPNRDGQMRFVQAHIHQASGTLMSLAVHEEPHWEDQRRWENQRAERDQYIATLDQVSAQLEPQMQNLQAAGDYVDSMIDVDLVDPGVAAQKQEEINVEQGRLEAMATDQVPMPVWMRDLSTQPAPPRMVPIHTFSHAVCLEPLVGNLGISYGRIQADLQRAANTIFSQYVDSASFGNVQSFLASKSLNLPQELEIAPGKVFSVDGMMDVEDIKKKIFPLSMGQANPQLMELMNLLMETSRTSVQAADILSGEPGKSGETYKGVAARIEQATKQLSVLARRFTDFLLQVLRNNAKLNSVYLEDEQLINVTDHIAGPRQIRVTRTMYVEDHDIEIKSDLRFATNVQKVAEADELANTFLANPYLAQNQQFAYQLIKNQLEARGRYDLVTMMGPPPQTPPVFGLPQPPPGQGQQGGGAPPQGGQQ